LSQDDLKRAAAVEAMASVRSGMVLGLGTGSTVRHFVDLLGEALESGRLSGIVGIPTSLETERQASAAGIPLATLGDRPAVDLTVDGADEISPTLDLIKGLGGALLREKMVAQASARLLIISDESKLVDVLGTRSPLPVEVVDWALDAQARFLESTGASVTLRMTGAGSPVRSDNGNVFLDCRYPNGIADASDLERRLAYRAGVVDSGLFLGMADEAVVAYRDGVRTLKSVA
jgi:ribose 5-phosphate isomerase A